MKTQLRKAARGATVIEYAMIAALLSIVAVVSVRTIGGAVEAKFEKVEQAIPTGSDAGKGLNFPG